MPEVFSAHLPGYEIWPRGWTIGPDSRLTNLSRNGRVKYLQEHLPEMLRFGWIEDQQVMGWYVDNLKSEKISEVRSRIQEDFNRQQITSEVLAIVTYLLSPTNRAGYAGESLWHLPWRQRLIGPKLWGTSENGSSRKWGQIFWFSKSK